MRLKFFKLIFVFVILSTACFSEVAKKDSDLQLLVEKVEFFYLDPTPTAAKKIIKGAKDLNCLDSFLGIFTAFARCYPREVVNWSDEVKINFEQHPNLIKALYMGGLEKEAIQLALKSNWPAQKIMPLGNKVQSFLTIPVNFVGSVQYLCSHFYISGDTRYGKRIIDVLELTSEQINNPEELKELKKDAKALLRELIFKHDKIYRLCLEEVAIRKGYSQAVLNQLLDTQHQMQKKTFPTQNGMLSGMMIATEDMNFEEQWENLPTMEGPLFKSISSISYPDTPEKNKTIRIFILFNGCELDEDLNAHLTYDMEILDPQGTKVADFHELPALKRKIPSRFLFQKADQSMVLAIKCRDDDNEGLLPGIFVINTTLKDHIARKDLKLTTKIELLPPEKKETLQSPL